MRTDLRLLSVAVLAIAAACSALGQSAPNFSSQAPGPARIPSAPSDALAPSPAAIPPEAASQAGAGSQPLFDFHDSDIKFSLASLMRTLRDGSHEGWVLAAYPDPKTKRPLIGAGFSLDVEARIHPQRDPLNPHPFLEPSSAQLWQAAGLEPERLQRILDRYDRDLNAWTAKRFRRKLISRALTPEVTDEEATRLLRISAIQAVSNARAYCHGFDQLSASQQMALSQLVFQMGVNLEEFVQFLGVLNNLPPPAGLPEASLPRVDPPGESQETAHWETVQNTLIASQWARLYSRRASTVIAMFDPGYSDDPSGARHRVDAVLHPAVVRKRRVSHQATLKVAARAKSAAGNPRKHNGPARGDRTVRRKRAGK
jgi:hypothetical protein